MQVLVFRWYLFSCVEYWCMLGKKFYHGCKGHSTQTYFMKKKIRHLHQVCCERSKVIFPVIDLTCKISHFKMAAKPTMNFPFSYNCNMLFMGMSKIQKNINWGYLWKTGATRGKIHENRYLNSKLSHLCISDVFGHISLGCSRKCTIFFLTTLQTALYHIHMCLTIFIALDL